MDTEIKITLLNVQKIIRKETGEVITKCDYMTLLEQTKDFSGYSVLTAWVDNDAFNKLNAYIGKEVVAKIGMKKSKSNGLTCYLKSINNISI
jgi:hypothetical protein